MHGLTQKCFEKIFCLLCWCGTIGMVLLQCHKYYMDEDTTVIQYNVFYHSPTDVFPSFSIFNMGKNHTIIARANEILVHCGPCRLGYLSCLSGHSLRHTYTTTNLCTASTYTIPRDSTELS